jgi:D-cysteine desulfhydrase
VALTASSRRVALGVFPTPLVRDERLGDLLGIAELWVKRDDLSGFSWGGNKVRAAEFLLGDAQAHDAEVVVICGGPTSNFAAVMAAAAGTVGMSVHQVSYGHEPPTPPAALVAAREAGAEISFTGCADRSAMESVAMEVAGHLSTLGKSPYVVPRGGATVVGALGFAAAAVELGHQLDANALEGATIVMPVGSGGSLAGLLAGLPAGRPSDRSTLDIVGVSVSRPPAELADAIGDKAAACAELLGRRRPTHGPSLVDGRGAGFGIPDANSEALAAEIARRTGHVVDPVYNAKALAWLNASSSAFTAGRRRPVVYWHTGGALGVVDRLSAAHPLTAASHPGGGIA